MYKLLKSPFIGEVSSVNKIGDGVMLSIPFDPANTDYQKFKSDILAGAELQDADGNPMTQTEATTFIETLP